MVTTDREALEATLAARRYPQGFWRRLLRVLPLQSKEGRQVAILQVLGDHRLEDDGWMYVFDIVGRLNWRPSEVPLANQALDALIREDYVEDRINREATDRYRLRQYRRRNRHESRIDQT
jgi:hypothetical protein